MTEARICLRHVTCRRKLHMCSEPCWMTRSSRNSERSLNLWGWNWAAVGARESICYRQNKKTTAADGAKSSCRTDLAKIDFCSYQSCFLLRLTQPVFLSPQVFNTYRLKQLTRQFNSSNFSFLSWSLVYNASLHSCLNAKEHLKAAELS